MYRTQIQINHLIKGIYFILQSLIFYPFTISNLLIKLFNKCFNLSNLENYYLLKSFNCMISNISSIKEEFEKNY